MNVQFSLSASTSSRVSQNTDNKGNLGEQSSTDLKAAAIAIKSTKELSQVEKQGRTVSVGEEQLLRTIERAVKSLQGPQTTLDISIHDKTHEIMVKVLNKDTGEVIREVPPEKTLDLVAKMMELAGLLVDEKI